MVPVAKTFVRSPLLFDDATRLRADFARRVRMLAAAALTDSLLRGISVEGARSAAAEAAQLSDDHFLQAEASMVERWMAYGGAVSMVVMLSAGILWFS